MYMYYYHYYSLHKKEIGPHNACCTGAVSVRGTSERNYLYKRNLSAASLRALISV